MQRTEPQPIRFDGVMELAADTVTETTTMKLLLKFQHGRFVLIFLPASWPPGAMTRRMLERNARRRCNQARLLNREGAGGAQLHLHAGGAAARDADEVRLPAAVGAGLGPPRCWIEEPPRVRLLGSHAEPDQPARPGWSGRPT